MNALTHLAPLAAVMLVAATACSSETRNGQSTQADAGVPPRKPDPGVDSKSAHYRGYVAMNEILRSRLVAKPTSFTLSQYLEDPSSDAGTGLVLAKLLGDWSGDGSRNAFQNGDPNAMSLVIWRMAFTGLGKDVASLCPGASKLRTIPDFELRSSLVPVVQSLCTWPQDQAREDTVLRSFWQGLTGYDAPPKEYEAWREEFLGPTFQNATAETLITTMVTAALLNPYVLLEQ
ncbi:hypothetical protein LVJ94_39685 [Pendulispora rubella]|uniref:Uncharacterized protein n=1 Tax=Pendulispora rubella TaxID=2741070 RepID=A0ABZ2KWN0_9BACT